MSILRCVAVAAMTGLMSLNAVTVSAQEYPNRLIRIVVASPGGGSDFTARRIAQGISGPLGQSVIVDYRGASLLSLEYVLKSPPDGYTLYVTGSTLWVVPLLRNSPYDAERDFTPITLTDQSPFMVAVHPSLPVKSVKELIAFAAARPGELNYGASSPGSPAFFAGESLKSMTGIKMLNVHYKAAGQNVTALVSGEVQVTITDTVLLMSHVKSGRARGLAVASEQPSRLAPGMPTAAAAGLPGFEAVGRTGLFGPARMPPAIINRLNQEVVRYLNRPDVKESFLELGTEVVSSTPEQLAALIKSEIAKISKLIKDSGIRIE